MTEAVNAAMVTHALLVADAAKDFFQVHLASFGGRLDDRFGNVVSFGKTERKKRCVKKGTVSVLDLCSQRFALFQNKQTKMSQVILCDLFIP